MSQPQTLEEIILEKKERINYLQVRSIVISVLIIASAIGWLIYTEYKVHSLEGEMTALQKKKDSVVQQLQGVSNVLRQAKDIKIQDINSLYASSDPKVVGLVNFILARKDEYSFSYNAVINPDNLMKEELNSPSFMQFAMNEEIKRDFNALKKIKYTHQALQDGDIVYYKSGIVMLYCSGDNGFVIGMTQLNILTLQPDFTDIDFIAHFPK